MNKILKEHFENMFSSNRVGHSFLLCNTNYDNLKEDLEEILSDYFFHEKIDIDNNPDIYILKPENGSIKKEAILELQSEFKYMSQIHDNRIYIIDHAELMNDYASNSLLKYIEEPEKNIYAFLITSNVNKILPTIKSRCQVLFISNGSDLELSKIDSEIIDKVVSFVMNYEKIGIDIIADEFNYLDKKVDKETLKTFIRLMKYFYRDILNYKIYEICKDFMAYESKIKEISEKNEEKSIINKLIVLNKYENMLEYNLNINLFLDNLIIEMEEHNE